MRVLVIRTHGFTENLKSEFPKPGLWKERRHVTPVS